jgi:hypothetical protein
VEVVFSALQVCVYISVACISIAYICSIFYYTYGEYNIRCIYITYCIYNIRCIYNIYYVHSGGRCCLTEAELKRETTR